MNEAIPKKNRHDLMILPRALVKALFYLCGAYAAVALTLFQSVITSTKEVLYDQAMEHLSACVTLIIFYLCIAVILHFFIHSLSDRRSEESLRAGCFSFMLCFLLLFPWFQTLFQIIPSALGQIAEAKGYEEPILLNVLSDVVETR